MTQITARALRRRGFHVVGFWEPHHRGGVRLKRATDRPLHLEEVAAVYTFDEDGVINLIGSTYRFRHRMRDYQSPYRSTIGGGIKGQVQLHEAVGEGRLVRVMALMPEPLLMLGLKVFPVHGIECALRDAIQPTWCVAGIKH